MAVMPPDETVTPPGRGRRWLRDINVWIGVGGVVATIVVGVVTYWLTASSEDREYRERLRAARADILTAVSRSIGEGVVPDREKIASVIRSSRRLYGIKEADAETVESVLDDVVSRVLSNEFLDAKRREELSAKLLSVRASATTLQVVQEPPRKRAPTDEFALLFAVTAGTMAAAVLMVMFMRLRELQFRERADSDTDEFRRRRRQLQRLTQLVVMTLLMLVLIVGFVYFVARFGGRLDGLSLSETLTVKPIPADR